MLDSFHIFFVLDGFATGHTRYFCVQHAQRCVWLPVEITQCIMSADSHSIYQGVADNKFPPTAAKNIFLSAGSCFTHFFVVRQWAKK